MSLQVDINELKVTAGLAHLELQDEELERAFGAFQQMLEYFSAMQNADTILAGFQDGHEMANGSAEPEHFRADAADFSDAAPLVPAELVEKAAEHDGKFIVIPNVL